MRCLTWISSDAGHRFRGDIRYCPLTPRFGLQIADVFAGYGIGEAVISEFESRVERSVIEIRVRYENFGRDKKTKN